MATVDRARQWKPHLTLCTHTYRYLGNVIFWFSKNWQWFWNEMSEHPSSDEIQAHKSRFASNVQTYATACHYRRVFSHIQTRLFPQPLVTATATAAHSTDTPHGTQPDWCGSSCRSAERLPYLWCLSWLGVRLVDRKHSALLSDAYLVPFWNQAQRKCLYEKYVYCIMCIKGNLYVPGQTSQLGIISKVTFIKQWSPHWVKSSRSVHGSFWCLFISY